SRGRRELGGTRAAGRPPAGAFVGRVDDRVNAGRELTSLRSTFGNRVHFFGSRIWIDRKVPSGVSAYAARLWKSERVAIGYQNRISSHACGHRFAVHHSTSQLPGSRQ